MFIIDWVHKYGVLTLENVNVELAIEYHFFFFNIEESDWVFPYC